MSQDNTVYIMVWIEKEEKWYYFINDFDREQFVDGYGDYYIEVKDGIIVDDSYNNTNKGKVFKDCYDIGLWVK